MAVTSYGVNHPLAVKLWRKKLHQEALKQTWLSKFMGSDSNSMIQVLEETSKNEGDKVTVGLRMLLTGRGVTGDNTLEGNEEALTTYTDSVLIDQLRHAVRSAGKMSEQRVPFSVREEAMAGLKDWYADRLDTALFNHLCGNSAQTDTAYTGGNATSAPTTNRWLYADGNSAETSLTSGTSDQFNLTLIDTAVAMAETASPQIRPIRIKGDDYYVMFLDPWQVQDMRTSTTAGQWTDIQKAAMAGMDSTKSPIFTGALGMYNGVILHKSTRLYAGNFTDGGSVRVARAVLCGAQAASLCYGKGYEGDKMSWTEELFDYGNQLGVSTGCIFGVKKMVFNSEDFGSIVVSTTAVQS